MGYDIGPRLRKYREAQNLTQKEFAKLIGVSNSRVSNWEQGINRPDVDLLAKICEVLNVSPSELLDIFTKSDVANSHADDQELSITKKKLIANIEKMPDDEIAALLAFVNSLDSVKKTLGIE